MKNNDVREEIKRAGVFHWEVADALGVAESTFCKMLRKELPEEKKQKIYSAIKTLRREA